MLSSPGLRGSYYELPDFLELLSLVREVEMDPIQTRMITTYNKYVKKTKQALRKLTGTGLALVRPSRPLWEAPSKPRPGVEEELGTRSLHVQKAACGGKTEVRTF